MAEHQGRSPASTDSAGEGSPQMTKDGEQRRDLRTGHPASQNVRGENVMEQSIEEQRSGQNWLERDRKGSHNHERTHLSAPEQSRLDPGLQENSAQARDRWLRDAARKDGDVSFSGWSGYRKEEW